MVIKAGILSDTHLNGPDQLFLRQVDLCFADCEVIIHAGDLTDRSVLDVFSGKTVYAVHGNMCRFNTSRSLKDRLTFSLGGFTIGLTHGAQLGPDIESGLWNLFPEADCMIYGHTHRPACHRHGRVLIINPGSFQATGRWGAPGTYAILTAGSVLSATINEVPQLP